MDKMLEFVEKLNEYAYQYYSLDNPVVSDKEYDDLYDELVKLEKQTGIVLQNSPTKKVGGEIISTFTSILHRERLYSLDKSKTIEGLYEWEKRAKKIINKPFEYSVEYKYDGLTLNLTYENGEFIRAVTRGNGIVGEDVTAQVMTIKSLPLSIAFKGIVEVQGEGIMMLSELKKYNETAEEPLKNARNAVAGAIRNLNPKITAKRNLSIMFYAINYIEGKNIKSQAEIFLFLKQNKFNCCKYVLCSDMECAVKEIENIEKSRGSLNFLIDGAVIKVNDFKVREQLGFTDKFPRWAVAFKFEAEEITTIVKDIIWNVGRTGKLTPIALLDPVELSGATVKKATLNNYGDILRKKVKTGCRVLVRRSNDVIPEILGSTEIYEGNTDIIKPSVCPDCGKPLTDDGVNLYCFNTWDCPPQITGRLEHFGSKDAMDIEGFSEMTAKQLYGDLGIKFVSQLYKLNAETLLKLDGFKDKKAVNLLKSIQVSKKPALSQFIYALAIPNIGKKSAKDMADTFKTLDNILTATKEQLVSIEDFGDIMADSVLNYFADGTNKKTISDLLDAGVEIKKEAKKNEDGIFAGQFVVLTGTLSKFTRLEASKLIEKEGGEILSAVSSRTTLLIAGEEAGSKLNKAKTLGVKIIDETEFVKMTEK